ncbi:MAG: hypothetical protein JO362_14335 [Streptomycetaceae bacterium]|nr:hypothetical protein [Streptomycetaceae bacterium]
MVEVDGNEAGAVLVVEGGSVQADDGVVAVVIAAMWLPQTGQNPRLVSPG